MERIRIRRPKSRRRVEAAEDTSVLERAAATRRRAREIIEEAEETLRRAEALLDERDGHA